MKNGIDFMMSHEHPSWMIPSTSLETRDLRLVRAIAEAGGATQAARLLHLTQSAVSPQLGGVERRLGVTLFERVGRRLLIPPRGERLVALAQEILPPLARAELELKREGPLRRQR